jgi:hypothetical protein
LCEAKKEAAEFRGAGEDNFHINVFKQKALLNCHNTIEIEHLR